MFTQYNHKANHRMMKEQIMGNKEYIANDKLAQ